jgi:hypothetical protein
VLHTVYTANNLDTRSMQSNILHQLLAKQYGDQMLTAPAYRCNGASTAIAFKALADAMQHPKEPTYIHDHANAVTPKADWHTALLADGIVGKLQMVGFTFKRDELGYYVVYDLYPTEKL